MVVEKGMLKLLDLLQISVSESQVHYVVLRVNYMKVTVKIYGP
jgi:hypothetical protein